MQKSRLIEEIADLLNERKLPLLADVRDESTEDVRVVLEPRAATVDPGVMMDSCSGSASWRRASPST